MKQVNSSAKTILVVDDDPGMLEVIEDILSENGYDPICVTNGPEGLSILSQTHIDLVITDIFMPDMDGLEFITAVRKTHKLLKILAISGGGQMRFLESLAWAEAFGAGRVLKKPFDHEALLEALSEMLNDHSYNT